MENNSTLKIFICRFEQKTRERLQHFLLQQKMNFHLTEVDTYDLVDMVNDLNPDVVLTDQHFWDGTNGIDVLKQLRLTHDTPVLIWCVQANQKIMSAVFNAANTNFVKSTDDEVKLIEALRKIKAGVLTHY